MIDSLQPFRRPLHPCKVLRENAVRESCHVQPILRRPAGDRRLRPVAGAGPVAAASPRQRPRLPAAASQGAGLPGLDAHGPPAALDPPLAELRRRCPADRAGAAGRRRPPRVGGVFGAGQQD
ncbi:hypothetical protein G6F22_017913 [Rhizopus arrhizus]|nr:hypothetical protein G6F22_017913 [Rhizopus arrhizus]